MLDTEITRFLLQARLAEDTMSYLAYREAANQMASYAQRHGADMNRQELYELHTKAAANSIGLLKMIHADIADIYRPKVVVEPKMVGAGTTTTDWHLSKASQFEKLAEDIGPADCAASGQGHNSLDPLPDQITTAVVGWHRMESSPVSASQEESLFRGRNLYDALRAAQKRLASMFLTEKRLRDDIKYLRKAPAYLKNVLQEFKRLQEPGDVLTEPAYAGVMAHAYVSDLIDARAVIHDIGTALDKVDVFAKTLGVESRVAKLVEMWSNQKASLEILQKRQAIFDTQHLDAIAKVLFAAREYEEQAARFNGVISPSPKVQALLDAIREYKKF